MGCDTTGDQPLGNRAQAQPLEAAAAVRGHHDEVRFHFLGVSLDRVDDLPTEDRVVGLDARVTQSRGDAGQVLFLPPATVIHRDQVELGPVSAADHLGERESPLTEGRAI